MKKQTQLNFSIIILCMVSYMTSDIYLTLLFDVSKYFSTSLSNAQETISIYFFGLASSQILHGIIAGRYNIKKVFLSYATLFSLFSVMCYATKDIHFFIVCRFLESIFASGCIIAGQALFYTIYPPDYAKKQIINTTTLMPLSAAISPLIGSWLATLFGWKADFIFVITVINFILIPIIFYTSDAQEKMEPKNHMALSFSTIVSRTMNFSSLKYLLFIFLSTMFWFGYLISAPVFYKSQFNFTPNQMGPTIMLPLAIYGVGSLLFNNCIINLKKKFLLAFVLYSAGISMLSIMYLTHNFTAILFVTLFCLFTAGNSIIIPSCSAEFASDFKDISGIGIGISGTFRFLAASLITFIFSFFGDKISLQNFLIIYAVIFIFIAILYVSEIFTNRTRHA